MLGLTPDKIVILGVIAAFLLGPSRIPAAAAWLGRILRQLRVLAEGAKVRARDELGEEFDQIDWQKLDPRRYDPRRIIEDALQSTDPPSAQGHQNDPDNGSSTTTKGTPQ